MSIMTLLFSKPHRNYTICTFFSFITTAKPLQGNKGNPMNVAKIQLPFIPLYAFVRPDYLFHLIPRLTTSRSVKIIPL